MFTTGALLLGNYLLPTHRSTPGYPLCVRVTGLVGVAILLGRQVRIMSRGADFRLKAIEGFAFCVPAFLLLFAGSYFFLGRRAVTAFNVPLGHYIVPR